MNSYSKNFAICEKDTSTVNTSSLVDVEFHSKSNQLLKLKKELQYYQEKSLESELDICKLAFEYDNRKEMLDKLLVQKEKDHDLFKQNHDEVKRNVDSLKVEIKTLTQETENMQKETINIVSNLTLGIEEVKKKYESLGKLQNPDKMLEYLTSKFDLLTLNAINLQLHRVLRNKFPVSPYIYTTNNTQENYQFDSNTFSIDQHDEDYGMREKSDMIPH